MSLLVKYYLQENKVTITHWHTQSQQSIAVSLTPTITEGAYSTVTV